MPDDKTLIELTKKLVSMPSITDNSKINASVLDFIKEHLTSDKIIIKEFEKNNIKSLAFYPKNPAKVFDVIFHGHTDVVPANSDKDFKPYIENGKLYGRGACDMKGGLAVLILLFEQLIEEGNNKVALFITSDEEVGGKNGTKYLFEQLKPEAKFFITAEGSEGANILKYKQKGVLKLRLVANGKGGHAGYTWEGVNAIKKLYKVYSQIEALFPEDTTDTDHWYTTINLGTIEGGTISNSIPDHASAVINIRFADDWKTAERILTAINNIITDNPGTEIQVIDITPMVTNKKDHPLVVRLNRIAKEQLDLKQDFYFKNHGTNDARFAAAAGIPAVGFGPVGRNCHAKDEYISIESMKQYYKIYKKFTDSF